MKRFKIPNIFILPPLNLIEKKDFSNKESSIIFVEKELERNINLDFYNKIAELLKNARNKVVQTVNKTMVYTYFEIGRTTVEEEQKGKERAEYGKQIIKELSQKLTREFGEGFSTTNLKQMRQFYQTYSKSQTLSDQFEKLDFQLSWPHYLFLMKVDNPDERKFYEIEAISNG